MLWSCFDVGNYYRSFPLLVANYTHTIVSGHAHFRPKALVWPLRPNPHAHFNDFLTDNPGWSKLSSSSMMLVGILTRKAARHWKFYWIHVYGKAQLQSVAVMDQQAIFTETSTEISSMEVAQYFNYNNLQVMVMYGVPNVTICQSLVCISLYEIWRQISYHMLTITYQRSNIISDPAINM